MKDAKKIKSLTKDVKLIIESKKEQIKHINNVLNIKSYMLIVDVETVGSLKNPYPFDICVKVYDPVKREVIEQYSFIVVNYLESKALTDGCWCESKIPNYLEITSPFNKHPDKPFYYKDSLTMIVGYIEKLIKIYNPRYFWAFNVKFDFTAINNLYYDSNLTHNHIKSLLCGDIRDMFLLCLDKDRDLLAKYREYCKTYDKLTEKGYCKTDVESIFGFITDDPDFKEKHMGKDDTDNELAILQWSFDFFKKKNIPLAYDFNNFEFYSIEYLYTDKTKTKKGLLFVE